MQPFIDRLHIQEPRNHSLGPRALAPEAYQLLDADRPLQVHPASFSAQRTACATLVLLVLSCTRTCQPGPGPL